MLMLSMLMLCSLSGAAGGCAANADILTLCLPRTCSVAVGTVGVLNDEYAKKLFLDGFKEMVKRLEPKEILVYGNRLIELDEYKNVRWFEPYMNKFNDIKKKGH